MRTSCSREIEQLTGRTVIGFMSDNHIDPDLAVEVFILEPGRGGPRAPGPRSRVSDPGHEWPSPHPFQGTVATTDGNSIWAFRYSSERNSRSLFYTTDIPTLRKLHPERELLREFSDDARLIVSEPLGDVAGVWNEVPESAYGVVGPDRAEIQPFRPTAPSTSVPVVA
jgi:hypothetical protein